MYTFTTEGNRDSKKANGINNIVDDDYNTKTIRMFCSIYHLWHMKWTESKAKIVI